MGYIGIMEEEMEAAIQGLGFRKIGFRGCLGSRD